MPNAAVVAMDGFHLTQDELVRLGRAERKGAPDTFDVAGYLALLRLLRRREASTSAPVFDRDVEEPRAGGVTVPDTVSLVVTEGNYLLLDEPGWIEVRPLLDACWYVELDDEVRRQRLVARHVRHGRSLEDAERWVRTTDDPNARRIAATRSRADWVVQLS